MTEKVASYDRISTECGIVTLNIESIDCLTAEILSRPLEYQILSIEHFPEMSEESNSSIQHRFDIDTGQTRMYAEVPVDRIDRDNAKTDTVVRLLYDYLVVQAEFDENYLDVRHEDDTTYLSVHMPSGAEVSIEYSEPEPMLALLSQFDNDGTDDSSAKEQAVESLQVWTYVHDFSLWMCDADLKPVYSHRITVSAESQPSGSFVLMQSLAEYESWKKQIGISNLPEIDYNDIDFHDFGGQLERQGSYSQAELFAAVRSLAVTIRGINEKSSLSAADIRFAVLT